MSKPESTADNADFRPRLTVVGVGGAGCNAINNMIAAGLTGVEFIVANTDAQSLEASSTTHRIQLGSTLTEGLGAGSRPEIGEAAAEEAIEAIRKQVEGSHMVFIAAGMGGGTGTGAAAVVARAAKEQGILTVGVVTKPFQFEGSRRMRIAQAGIEELRKYVDTLIVIPNQNLFRIANPKTTFSEAFVLADQVLYSGVACIVDLIIKSGLINLDFADVKTVLSGMGTAMMGTGEASGEHRAIEAAEEAISNPLLDDVCLSGAKGLLLSITGGTSLTLFEVDAAASRVREEVDDEANIIVGATFDEELGDRIRVSIVASGMARIEPQNQQHYQAGPGVQIEPHAGRPPHARPAPAGHQSPAGGAAAPFAAHPAQQPISGPASGQDGQTTEDEMQRRLSEALRYSDEEQAADQGFMPPQAQRPSAPQFAPKAPPPAIPPSGGDDDVLIEEGLPPHLTQTAPGNAWRQPDMGRPPPQKGFMPAPPVDVRRSREAGRMPEVSDFPPIGQREYAAKAQGGYNPIPAPAPNPVGNRRRSLLDRITGRGKSESPAQAAPAPTSQPSLQPGPNQGGASNRQAAVRERATPAVEAQLPVFINRERN